MAERKAVNKYYPPDWDPSKGSVNKYVGQHPLRDRAKKLSQGILVIRFEMPYNIWCGGCNAHIGMGVRYNAEKTKTGNYYSTPIYKFRMKCHLCDNYFEIQTDPKNHDYVILEGARRKEQRWDPKENEQIVPEDKATQKKIATDAMFKLEHGTDDKQRGKKAVSNLAQLETSKEGMKDDYILNKIARNKFREEKKALKKVQEDDNALLTKSSLSIPLVKETEEDVKLAGLMRLRAVETYDERQVQKRKEIESRPIFKHKKRAMVDDSGSPQTKKLKIIRDNILKAKANFSTSPFDRMKTNTLGIGLTQDQLGIRKRTSKSIEYSNTDTVSTNKDETCGNDINSFSSEKHVSATKNVCISVSDSKCEERTGYHSLTERDTEEIIEENNAEPVGQRTVCDAIENKTIVENNHVEYDTSNEKFCHNDFKYISNCQSEKNSESILNKDFASNGHRTLDNDNQFVQVENNFKVLDSNIVSSPSLSLVAAYSDSEDTDTSNG